jgi:hypothetical protein
MMGSIANCKNSQFSVVDAKITKRLQGWPIGLGSGLIIREVFL